MSPNTALRQQFHYLFLTLHLPAEMLDKSRPQSAISMDWLLQLQDVVIQSPALETSIAAFFAAQVGRNYNDVDLVRQSRSLYVNGLERLQRALSSPQTRLSDETLAACVALSLYELTECPVGTPRASAYATHQRGAMMLLQLRGPDASTSPLGHTLFLRLRAQAVSPFSAPNGPLEFTKRPWRS